MTHMTVAEFKDVPASPENPLRLYRRQRHLTQPQLAQECGISASMVSQIERGHVIPSLQVTFRLSQCTGISLERLVRFCLNEPVPTLGAIVVDFSARRKAVEKLRS